MKRYTVGYIFTSNYGKVLLMTKNRPDWQVGKLNGIGGKIEAGESDLAAMVRECHEESALVIPEDQWTTICVMSGSDWEVIFLAALWPGSKSDAQSVTDEPVAWYETNNLPSNVIANLRWQIPLAISWLKGEDALEDVRVRYGDRR